MRIEMVAIVLAGGMAWASMAEANPAGSPPNLTLTSPNVSPTVPGVSPTPPMVIAPESRIIAAPRRCRFVSRTDRFGETHKVRRCWRRRYR